MTCLKVTMLHAFIDWGVNPWITLPVTTTSLRPLFLPILLQFLILIFQRFSVPSTNHCFIGQPSVVLPPGLLSRIFSGIPSPRMPLIVDVIPRRASNSMLFRLLAKLLCLFNLAEIYFLLFYSRLWGAFELI